MKQKSEASDDLPMPLETAGQNSAPHHPPPIAYGVLFGLSVAKLLIHLLTGGRYGYFRDELYFLACGRHLAWGYVDMAPLTALYAKIGLLLGGSLHALRFLPALAGAMLVALAILMARELGGGRFAQGLAGLCVLAAPVYLATDSILSMNAFEPLFWMGCIYVVIRIVNTGNSRLWLWFGVLAGLGLENKHSTAIFGFAVVVALLLAAERREFLKPWPWLGGAIALLIFLPNLIWQIHNHFPTLEDLRNVQKMGKNVELSPLAFFRQQIFMLHPITFPVWAAGVWFFLAGRGSRWRVLGWIYVVLLVTMIAMKAKVYYLAPIYPMLFAGGGAAVEDWLSRGRLTGQKLWPKAALLTIIVLAAAVTGNLALPILPPEKYVAYSSAIGVAPPKTEVAHSGPLPQIFGDQFGWPELVEQVAKIYWSLTPEERSRTAIYANNYGEAGAIDFFGPKYGLPAAISAHQNYYFWGPPGFNGDILIVLQSNRERLEKVCGSVEQAAVHFHPYGMAEENQPIFVCRGFKLKFPEIWPELKHWN